MNWMPWIHERWPLLANRAKLEAPSWLPHPRWTEGFSAIAVATPEGQIANWGLPLSDGSRIHVHEFSDGKLIAHRDQFDPERSPLHLVAHLALETPVGLIALACTVGALAGRSVRR